MGVVAIAGAIVTVVHPESLTFAQYIKDVAMGAGLLGIGYGLDAQSKP